MRVTRLHQAFLRISLVVFLAVTCLPVAPAQAFSGDPVNWYGVNGEAEFSTPAQVLFNWNLRPTLFGSDPTASDGAWITRTKSDGTLDTSFDGDGTVNFDIVGNENYLAAELDKAQRLVVAGYVEQAGQTEILVARYLENGAIDTTFGGGDGWLTINLPGGVEKALAVTFRVYDDAETQRIYLGGICNSQPCVIALTPFGDLDPTFGETVSETIRSGVRVFPESGAIRDLHFIADTTGFLAVGDCGQIAVWRLDGSGDLVPSYGVAGRFKLSNPVPTRTWDSAYYPYDENLRIAGSTLAGGSAKTSLVIQVTPSGRLDQTFGELGLSFPNLPEVTVQTEDYPTGIVPEPGGSGYFLSIQQIDTSLVAGGGQPRMFGSLARFNQKGGRDIRFTSEESWINDPRENFVAGGLMAKTWGAYPAAQGVYWMAEVNGQTVIRLIESVDEWNGAVKIDVGSYDDSGAEHCMEYSTTYVSCSSLRSAIDYANAASSDKTFLITLAGVSGRGIQIGGANEDANLTGDLDIRANITIRGIPLNGSRRIYITNSEADRLFHVHSGTLVLEGLILAYGSSPNGGGAVRVESGATVKILDSVLLGNQVASGGGPGGAVYSEGALYAFDSTFTQNLADKGGAIYATSGALVNVTLVDNNIRQADGGGGLATPLGADLELQNTLIANNHIKIGENTQPDDCNGPWLSRGPNLIETYQASACPQTGPAQPVLTQDPLLSTLWSDWPGGTVSMFQPQAGSPAIDAGLCVGTRLLDQRGSFRPLDGDQDGIAACDIGSYEVNNPPINSQPQTYHVPEDTPLFGVHASLSDPGDKILAMGVSGSGIPTFGGVVSTAQLETGQAGFYYYPQPEVSGVTDYNYKIVVQDTAASYPYPYEFIIDPINDPPVANAIGTYTVTDTIPWPDRYLEGYSFHENTSSGTETPLPADAQAAEHGYTTVDLPFSFPFFGEEYDQVHISNNGYLTFAESQAAIPVNPGTAIVPINQDLYFKSGTSRITYKEFPDSLPERHHWVVTFTDLAMHAPLPPGITGPINGSDQISLGQYSYDIALYADGAIVVGYTRFIGPVGDISLRGSLPGQVFHYNRGVLPGFGKDFWDLGVLYRPVSLKTDALVPLEIPTSSILPRAYDVEKQTFALDTTQPMVSDQGVVVEVNANGSLVYSPGSTVSGLDSFPYTITENGPGGLSSTGRIFIQVTGLPNSAPTAVNDTLTVDENTPLTFTAASLLGNDTDPDGDSLTVTQVANTSSQGGSISLSDGVYTYTPPANFNGLDTITYTIEDTHHASDQGTIQVTVTETVDLQAALVREGTGPIPLSDDTVLTFTLTNADLDPATGVQVRGEWSAGLTVNLPSAGCAWDGIVAFVCFLDDFGPSQSLAFTVRVRASDSAAPGQLQTFKLSINGTKKDCQPANNQAPVELTTPAAPTEILTFIPLLVR